MSATVDAVAAPPDAVAEAKAHLRLEGGSEDALIARLIATAVVACEGFTGTQLMIRAARQQIVADGEWRRIGLTPVQVVAGVSGLAANGASFVLPAGSYATRIDADGDGWVRVTQAGTAISVLVQFSAGLAAVWSELPEPLRQGILRLAAHLYTHRDAADGSGPPAAVTALWRPWRRMRLR